MAAGCASPTASTPPTPTPSPTDPLRITCPAPQTIQSANRQSLRASPIRRRRFRGNGSGHGQMQPAGDVELYDRLDPRQVHGDRRRRSVPIRAPLRHGGSTATAPDRGSARRRSSVSATAFPRASTSCTSRDSFRTRRAHIPPICRRCSPPGTRLKASPCLMKELGGETVADGSRRLPGVLTRDRPDALLLLEGVNDLNQFGASAIPTIASDLRSMVRDARGRGVTVFLATLTPQRAGGSRAFSVDLVEPMNARIRALAPAEGAVLVDLYRDFNGELGLLIGADGLHPTVAGYQRIAESFFAAIASDWKWCSAADIQRPSLGLHGQPRVRSGEPCIGERRCVAIRGAVFCADDASGLPAHLNPGQPGIGRRPRHPAVHVDAGLGHACVHASAAVDFRRQHLLPRAT